jgi:YD repeat-containing protein
MGADGSLQSITDLSGNSLTVTAAGITSSPSGVSVPFMRDGQGRITQITDTLGRNYLYGYDANGNLATVTFPGIATPAKYQYDATHLVTNEIDRRGNSNTSTYYADGRLQSITDAAGNTTQYAYDTTDEHHHCDQRGRRDDHDRWPTLTASPLSVTDPLGRTTTYTYDANHDMLTRTDPLGNTWTYTYDANGNPTSSSDPLGDTSTTQYNQYSGPLAQTDAVGQREDHGLRRALPAGADDRHAWGDRLGGLRHVTGLITSATDANGNASQLSYNAWGNVIGAIDALGYTASATYDAMGNRLTQTDALRQHHAVHLRRRRAADPDDAGRRLLDQHTVRRPGQRHGARGRLGPHDPVHLRRHGPGDSDEPAGRHDHQHHLQLARAAADGDRSGGPRHHLQLRPGRPVVEGDRRGRLDHPDGLRRRRAQDQLDRSARPCHHLHSTTTRAAW